MLKKINDIFRLKGIFDFSHLQFDTFRAQSDGSGTEGKKKLEQWRWSLLNFSSGSQGIAIFLMAHKEFSLHILICLGILGCVGNRSSLFETIDDNTNYECVTPDFKNKMGCIILCASRDQSHT